jgi:hypothetical protein
MLLSFSKKENCCQALYNETQILQAERRNLCQLNYPMCEAKWEYSNEIQASETKCITKDHLRLKLALAFMPVINLDFFI